MLGEKTTASGRDVKAIPFSERYTHSEMYMSRYTQNTDLMFFFRFVVLQMLMRSPLFRLQTWVLFWSFHKASTTCLRTAKALARLRLCAGSPEPLLVTYVINTFFSCAGLLVHLKCLDWIFKYFTVSSKSVKGQARFWWYSANAKADLDLPSLLYGIGPFSHNMFHFMYVLWRFMISMKHT